MKGEEVLDAKETMQSFREAAMEEFINGLSADDPTPGGGTVSAMAGAMAAGLVIMVAALTDGKNAYKEAWEEAAACSEEAELLREELLDLADEDTHAFDQVMAALRMPRGSEREKKARARALQGATRQATEVPRQVVSRCLQVTVLALQMAERGNANAVSDALVAGELAAAGLRGALANVRINLGSPGDDDYRCVVLDEMQRAVGRLDELLPALREAAEERL